MISDEIKSELPQVVGVQKIDLVRDRPVINLLGEVCWGLHVNDFEKKMGVKMEVAEGLLRRLINEEKKGFIETFLNPQEISMIKKALTIVEIEIEGSEFQTRLGVTLEYVKSLPLFKSN